MKVKELIGKLIAECELEQEVRIAGGVANQDANEIVALEEMDTNDDGSYILIVPE